MLRALAGLAGANAEVTTHAASPRRSLRFLAPVWKTWKLFKNRKPLIPLVLRRVGSALGHLEARRVLFLLIRRFF